MHKAYDRSAMEKGYKDKDFEAKERADIDNLELAIKFVRQQVEQKRRTLIEIEKQTKQARHEAR